MLCPNCDVDAETSSCALTNDFWVGIPLVPSLERLLYRVETPLLLRAGGPGRTRASVYNKGQWWKAVSTTWSDCHLQSSLAKVR